MSGFYQTTRAFLRHPSRKAFFKKVNAIVVRLTGDDSIDIECGMDWFTVNSVYRAVLRWSSNDDDFVSRSQKEENVLTNDDLLYLLNRADVENCVTFFNALSDVVTTYLHEHHASSLRKPMASAGERLRVRQLVSSFFDFVDSNRFTPLHDYLEDLRLSDEKRSKQSLAETTVAGIDLLTLVEYFESHVEGDKCNDGSMFSLCERLTALRSVCFLRRLETAVQSRPLWHDQRCMIRLTDNKF
jgi:hypothetical protein